jgi:hypothetical protein
VDDEPLLDNDPVKQHWKGSDRCCAMAQYTGVNNVVEDVLCVVGAAVVWQSGGSGGNAAVRCETVTEQSASRPVYYKIVHVSSQ